MKFFLFIAFLLIAAVTTAASSRDIDAEKSKKPTDKTPGGLFGPGGGGSNIPGWGDLGGAHGGGYGGGYGGPGGGYSYGGVIRPSVVCTENGPCYEKKLTCPDKCFSSYSQSGSNSGGGGGGGGCTMDCKKKCIAYC